MRRILFGVLILLVCVLPVGAQEAVPEDAQLNVVPETCPNPTYNPKIDPIWACEVIGVPGQTITFSFYDETHTGGYWYGVYRPNYHVVSEEVKANFRALFAYFTLNTAHLHFQEVADTTYTYGKIRIMAKSDMTQGRIAEAYGPCTTSATCSDIFINDQFDGPNLPINPATGQPWNAWNNLQLSIGNHGYHALFHEVGHALGLKHPDGTMPPDKDHILVTAMSYNHGVIFPPLPDIYHFVNYDITALRYFYGNPQ